VPLLGIAAIAAFVGLEQDGFLVKSDRPGEGLPALGIQNPGEHVSDASREPHLVTRGRFLTGFDFNAE
jgi:hypothetical protein